jgi:dihydroorotase-like cyclic amidohydrolase
MVRWQPTILTHALSAVTANPSRLLGLPFPCLAAGHPANLVLFRMSEAGDLTIERTCVDGRWFEPEPTSKPA